MFMKKVQILWTDDEIDLLKPHILFLESKGYSVSTASNGADAIELVERNTYDLIFLDENMPGLSGLETLNKIMELKPGIPVVMITKSEEEDFMDAAIGSKIADYLIKPVNPNQILLSIKKNIDNKKLITSKTTSAYQSEFNKIGQQLGTANCFNDWVEIYKKLIFWELEFDVSQDSGMNDILQMQKTEAETEFAKFVRSNYLKWLDTKTVDKPLLSPGIFKLSVIPKLVKNEKIVFILIDNLRYDQWRAMQPVVNEYYNTDEEKPYCSILPTSTQYARNSIFSGLMPLSIEKLHPKLWLNDYEEGGKNEHEEELLQAQLLRSGVKAKLYYEKIYNSRMGSKIIDKLSNILQNDLIVLVYNFVDMLSHANTDMEMIRELAVNDSAYRSLTLSWFQHSKLNELLRKLSEQNIKVILTTDHGTIRVSSPVKVVGDKDTSKNLRYKTGRNLSYNPKEVFEVADPAKAYLPKPSVSSKYIFAFNNDFLAYPNNFNYYVKYYSNTYQHGGISMGEMILPLVTMVPKGF
ncbi:MAG: bifunctional response regulator/alkaline phosphatase family protein [Bacteroidales bacterium]|nr:bifunctional response regulator/alkaline phosphatase family protein [Bacteroidales bacterium]